MKYKDWLDEWLDYYAHPALKERTYKKYKDSIRLHIAPALGDLELEELTASVLQRFVIGISENKISVGKKGLAANSVRGLVTLIRQSLHSAVKAGLIQQNNADSIQLPKTEEKQIECFSLEEQRKIENYILNGGKTKLFGVVLCLYTGLRIGELLSLTWDDVDLDKGILSVTKTCHDIYRNGSYEKVIGSPKTKSSRRVIPLPKQLLSLIKAHKKSSQSEYIVANKTKDISVRSYQRTFEITLRKLGIRHRGFHSLRHTFATRALECGMDIRTLAEILGHKNPAVTLNRYAHSMFEHKAAMMNKMGKLLQ